MKITLILPTYNEAENLPKIIPAILEQPLPELKIIVVDDHSSDGTGAIAERLVEQWPGKIEVLHRSGQPGLGRAYVYGFDRALLGDAEAIGQMDCDFSHSPEKLPELAAKLATCDLALGSRYIPGGGVDQRWPLWRRGLSAWGNFYARTILGLPIRDVTGGFRLWRREMLERIPYRRVVSNGYVFLVEILYLAHKQGCHFGEVPIYFADRQWGESKMSLRNQLEAAMRIWQVKWRYR